MDSCLIAAYSPGDSEFTLQLTAQLKNRGFDVFLDITDGRTLQDDQLSQLYLRASGLIAVVTREFLESSYGRAELAVAARHGYPVILIALRTVPAELLPRGMTLQGVLDFSGWRDERRFRAQIERLITAIAVQTGQRPRPPGSEVRYLNDLIARLSARQSTIEFDPINRSIQNPRLRTDVRPLSVLATLWGVNSRLRLIVPQTETTNRIELPAQTIGEALAQVHRAMLVGEAGSGKTSMMERLALDIAYENLQQIAAQSTQSRFPMPIVIDLAACDPDVPLIDHIRALWRQYELQADPIELLRLGGAVLMLDGLDELGAAGDARAAEIRAWIASDDAPSYMVVTCRSDQVPRYDLGLAQIECLPMNEAGTRRLIEATLGDHAHDLQLKVAEGESLPEAIRTLPAHLLTLIRLYKHEPTHELPRSLGRLYRRLVATLWTARAESDDPIRISSQELSRPLSALAVAILDGQLPHAVLRADAVRFMTGEAYVDEAVRSGLLVSRAGRLRFASRWLMDAFAALYLTPADVIPRLMTARVDGMGRRLGSAWDQALILYSGSAAVPDVVVREIAEVDPLLASRCIDSGVRVSDSVMNLIEEGLAGMMKAQHSGVPLAAAQALSGMGRAVNPATLLDIARSGDWSSRAEAVHVLMDMPLVVRPALLDALKDWDLAPGDETAAALTSLKSDALLLLMHMLRDASEDVRRGAAWGLGVIGDGAALMPLVNTLTDPDPLVKAAAVRALGQFTDPGLVPPLMQILNEPHPYLRNAALESLRNYPNIVVHQANAILSGTQFDQDGRLALVELLADFGAETAVQHIVPLAQHTEPALRAAAARAFGRLKDPNTIDLLRTMLEDDTLYGLEGRHVCDDAIEALKAFEHPRAKQIVKGWTYHRPSEEQLRRQRLEEQRVIKLIDGLSTKLRDPDPRERADVLYQIARQDHPVAIPHLTRAVHDEDVEVRRTAVQGLRRFSADSDALQALGAALRDDQLIDEASQVLVDAGERASGVLEDALSDANPAVRAIAAESLAALAHKGHLRRSYAEGLVSILAQMVNDPTALPFEGATVGQRCGAALQKIERWLVPILRPDELPDPAMIADDDDPTTRLISAVETEAFIRSRNYPGHDDTAEIVSSPDDEAAEDMQPQVEAADEGEPLAETDADATEPDLDMTGIETAQVAEKDSAAPVGVDTKATVEIDVKVGFDETVTEIPAADPPVDKQPDTTEEMPAAPVDENAEPAPVTGDARELAAWPELGALLNYLTDSDNALQVESSQRLIRGAKARAAAGMTSGPWLDTLLEALESANPLVRNTMMDAIAELRTPLAVPALIRLLSHPSALTRRVAASTLDRIAEPDGMRAVIPLLMDSDWAVRETACRMVIKRHEVMGADAIPGLEAMLGRLEDRPSWDLAVEALGRLGSAASVPLLIAMARHDDLYLRTALVRAFKRLKPVEAIPVLGEMLNDMRPAASRKSKQRIDELAAEALAEIDTPEARELVTLWRSRVKP